MDPDEAEGQAGELEESVEESESRASSVEDAEIKETDIVFDCPHCGKSLAIDYKGAGLSIPCTDCGQLVEVPIPEGMELEDIDKNEEEKESVILHLRKALATAEDKIKHLEADIRDLDGRRDSLEKSRTENIYRFGAIVEKVGVLQKAMDEMAQSLRKIMEIARDQADSGRPSVGRRLPPPSSVSGPQ